MVCYDNVRQRKDQEAKARAIQTYCPGSVPPMARCPCRGFPTMQRAPAVSREVGGAS